MNLDSFPMDKQTCKLEVESCTSVSHGPFFPAWGCGHQKTKGRLDSERDGISPLLPPSPFLSPLDRQTDRQIDTWHLGEDGLEGVNSPIGLFTLLWEIVHKVVVGTHLFAVLSFLAKELQTESSLSKCPHAQA